jgi:hypothetical protein
MRKFSHGARELLGRCIRETRRFAQFRKDAFKGATGTHRQGPENRLYPKLFQALENVRSDSNFSHDEEDDLIWLILGSLCG